MEVIKEFLDKVFLTSFSEWSFVTFFVLIILSLILIKLSENDGKLFEICFCVGFTLCVVLIVAFLATLVVEFVSMFVFVFSGGISVIEFIIRLVVIALVVTLSSYLLRRFRNSMTKFMSELV
jgi:hypothetical protein